MRRLILLALIPFAACALFDNPPPETDEAIACLVQGGDWIDGECIFPPDPEPTPTPTPEPDPTPTPEPVCDFPQGVPDREFTGLPVSSAHASTVNEVMAEITSCNVGSRCVHGESPQEFMRLVVAALRERGLCAGQHITGHTDEIAVATICKGKWEGYHIAYFGEPSTVVWSPGANRPAYLIPSKYCIDNTDPPPPPILTCPDPIPDPSKLTFSLKGPGQRGNWDGTALVKKACDYCESIGLGRHGKQIRCSCPVRPDGHLERSVCEQFVVGGDPRWFCNDREIESKVNPYKAKCNGVVRLCNANLTKCSESS